MELEEKEKKIIAYMLRRKFYDIRKVQIIIHLNEATLKLKKEKKKKKNKNKKQKTKTKNKNKKQKQKTKNKKQKKTATCVSIRFCLGVPMWPESNSTIATFPSTVFKE
jgi:hypothetical protein